MGPEELAKARAAGNTFYVFTKVDRAFCEARTACVISVIEEAEIHQVHPRPTPRGRVSLAFISRSA